MRVLARSAAVLAIAAASVLAPLGLPAAPALADSTRRESWHLKALEIPELHKIAQGDGVVVAVIDTGVDAKHQDLKDNVLPGVDFYDEDARGRVDRVGHGTAIASLIAGHGHGRGNRDGVLGIAPKAKILPVTIKSKRSPLIQPTAIAAGINWAVDHGADIINVSLSSSFNEELNQAVERAYQRNVIVVAAVGNRQDSIIASPASHQSAMAVNGTDRSGTISEEAALPAEQVDIAAPGEDIVHAVPGNRYDAGFGSSLSTALVSGALALVKAEYPDLNGYEMFQRLLETTRDEGEPGHDLHYGWGALDIRQALTGEPDGRGTRPSASAAGDYGLEPWQADPREREDGILVFVWAVIIAVLLLIVGGVVATVMLLRGRARQLQTEPADEDPSDESAASRSVASAAGGPVPPAGDADQPVDRIDDTVWQRPPG
ncbi:type VII secretion-associated serine protease mycosin [Verrucosispora sp. WMMD573]|uniref:type VII secretion-associated serine protease mycosin n=1 Tax=Verrucosispora sp. WMMD573 TaxID=3015149 RepID=UPI00248C28C9|nr:type VII secretion-associated serine protease mycosin [Verrucosispora sp. WMMD573]WBB55560.1 type VII secretion-associated serine protease mycosin [Verrucosispora sp. WMMD573]